MHALARTHTQDVSSQSNECINKISLFIIAIIITMNKARSDAISGAAWLGKGWFSTVGDKAGPRL